MVTEIQKTDAGKKLSAAAEEVLKQTRAAAEMIEKAAEQIGDNQIYQNVSSVSALSVLQSYACNLFTAHFQQPAAGILR